MGDVVAVAANLLTLHGTLFFHAAGCCHCLRLSSAESNAGWDPFIYPLYALPPCTISFRTVLVCGVTLLGPRAFLPGTLHI